ncbi:hypothetical protein RR46_00704 [Papilio xuthus]|uniref:Uncharacterized protein n=1 Tax=Papilio xuthus TaxID=66420 RepID=A0A0N1PGG8_PAPXU|nr:hypothetical protein RR46_00704 [Papilio xuthus]
MRLAQTDEFSKQRRSMTEVEERCMCQNASSAVRVRSPSGEPHVALRVRRVVEPPAGHRSTRYTHLEDVRTCRYI